MDIAPTNQPIVPPGQTIPGSAPKAAALSSDFETFIKMLTTQMKNQDPLNPIESADFAVQLATFSNVEQQVKTNDLLSSLGDRIGSLGVAQLSGWVGMDARARMPVSFSGAPVTLDVTAAAEADAAELVVRDINGNEIQRLSAPTTSGSIEWLGHNEFGDPLLSGTYKISLDSYREGELIASNMAVTNDRIIEARSENGDITLVMSGGQQVAANDIIGLRAPDD